MHMFSFGLWEILLQAFVYALLFLASSALRRATFYSTDHAVTAVFLYVLLAFTSIGVVAANDLFSFVLFSELLSFIGVGFLIVFSERISILTGVVVRYVSFSLVGSNLLYAGVLFIYGSSGVLD